MQFSRLVWYADLEILGNIVFSENRVYGGNDNKLIISATSDNQASLLVFTKIDLSKWLVLFVPN